jgi:cell division protein FtsI/penicillin-binding protein 2
MAAITRTRLVLVSTMIVCLAAAIAARLYQVQVIRCSGLTVRAVEQHQSRLVVPAMRGAIVDRNGTLLALSVESRSLYAHPRRVTRPEEAADLLAPLLEKSRREILNDLRSDRSFVYLERFLDPETADRIEALGLPTDGEVFGFDKEPSRVYPQQELASHVVGFATIDGDGVAGVEQSFDSHLKGDPKIYLLLKDAHHRGPRQLIREPKKKPSEVVLTLDLVLQHVVERELDRAVRETRARAISAVLLDPRNGEVLAMANRPTADPNHFGRAPASARRNRVVSDHYEPGSTFKIVTLSAAMELGRIGTRDRIFCERGRYRLPGRTIRDISSNGSLTPAQILSKSSNIGITKIAMKLTPREMADAIERFGFGRETGIALPGEASGFVADPSQWSGFSQASISFGQEIAVTALQMAGALAVFANDGVLVEPQIALGTREPGGRLRPLAPPHGRRVLSEKTARTVSRMLEGVVEHGTGRRAAVEGYRVAGKSGTAQRPVKGGYSEDAVVASFGGYAPAGDPRLVLLVVVDSPRGDAEGGGEVAAPVFARIMDDALRHLRVPGDAPERQATLVRAEPAPRKNGARGGRAG